MWRGVGGVGGVARRGAAWQHNVFLAGPAQIRRVIMRTRTLRTLMAQQRPCRCATLCAGPCRSQRPVGFLWPHPPPKAKVCDATQPDKLICAPNRGPGIDSGGRRRHCQPTSFQHKDEHTARCDAALRDAAIYSLHTSPCHTFIYTAILSLSLSLSDDRMHIVVMSSIHSSASLMSYPVTRTAARYDTIHASHYTKPTCPPHTYIVTTTQIGSNYHLLDHTPTSRYRAIYRGAT